MNKISYTESIRNILEYWICWICIQCIFPYSCMRIKISKYSIRRCEVLWYQLLCNFRYFVGHEVCIFTNFMSSKLKMGKFLPTKVIVLMNTLLFSRINEKVWFRHIIIKKTQIWVFWLLTEIPVVFLECPGKMKIFDIYLLLLFLSLYPQNCMQLQKQI